MTVEKIELRRILTQMLADNGINRETIVPFVKEIIEEKVDKALDRVINEQDLDSVVKNIVKTEAAKALRDAVDKKIHTCFSSITVSVNTRESD